MCVQPFAGTRESTSQTKLFSREDALLFSNTRFHRSFSSVQELKKSVAHFSSPFLAHITGVGLPLSPSCDHHDAFELSTLLSQVSLKLPSKLKVPRAAGEAGTL